MIMDKRISLHMHIEEFYCPVFLKAFFQMITYSDWSHVDKTVDKHPPSMSNLDSYSSNQSWQIG